MLRILNIFLILAVIAGAAIVYGMKHDAEDAADRVADLQRSIDDEQEKISLLKAEWSVLNQPARLQRLVERYNAYLQLQSLEVDQIASIQDLPNKPINIVPFNDDPLGGYAEGGAVIR